RRRNSRRRTLVPDYPAWMRGPRMEFSTAGNAEARATAGVRAALQRVRREARRFGWQVLLVGSGFWLGAAGGTAGVVVDLADVPEQRRRQSGRTVTRHWSVQLVHGMLGGLVRAIRRCEPAARAWQRLAARTDVTLLERRNLSRDSDTAVQAPAVW